MKKTLFITYYWPPSGGAGVQRGLKFVKYLPEFGVEPFVLTVDPDQASYPIVDPSLLIEVPREVQVIRTKSFEPLRILAAIGGKNAVPHAGFAGAEREGMARRAMRWVRGNWMIPDARRGWVKHAVKAAAEIIEREKIGTIVISSPPHSSQLIGLELKKRFPMLRWIADLRDPWTDIYFTKELMKGPRAERLDKRWEAQVMHRADAIVVVGPSMKRSFGSRYGKEVEEKITVIPNGYDQADVARIAKPALDRDRFRITYVGTMAGSYDPRVFFEAIAAIRGQVAKPIELRFVGSVATEIRRMAEATGVGDLCTWVATVPHDEALREMAAAHMLLLVIPGGAGEERILTGKLFEYIGMQRPVVGIGPANGDAAAIIDACGAGMMFSRDRPVELGNWLLQRIGSPDPAVPAAGARAYERRVQADRLAALINAGA